MNKYPDLIKLNTENKDEIRNFNFMLSSLPFWYFKNYMLLNMIHFYPIIDEELCVDNYTTMYETVTLMDKVEFHKNLDDEIIKNPENKHKYRKIFFERFPIATEKYLKDIEL